MMDCLRHKLYYTSIAQVGEKEKKFVDIFKLGGENEDFYLLLHSFSNLFIVLVFIYLVLKNKKDF